MSEKKESKEIELTKVNGGSGSEDTPMITCCNCGELFSPYSAESRTCGSRCDDHSEYKCPECGTWQKYD